MVNAYGVGVWIDVRELPKADLANTLRLEIELENGEKSQWKYSELLDTPIWK